MAARTAAVLLGGEKTHVVLPEEEIQARLLVLIFAFESTKLSFL